MAPRLLNLLIFIGVNCLNSEAHLIFLKTHKTGSSTVATMLHRLNMICFVPPEGYDAHKWDFDDRLDVALYLAQEKRQLDSTNKRFEMWTSHAIYNSYLTSIISHPFLVTIVRNPTHRWISAFQFYDLPKRYGFTMRRNDSRWVSPNGVVVDSRVLIAESIIADSWVQFQSCNFLNLSIISVVPSQWAFNGMSMELAGSVYGPLLHVEDAVRFAARIRNGSWSFSQDVGTDHKELVMILDRFEESVVLLGILLGLSSGVGLNSQLLYSRPMNPTKRSSKIILSDLAISKLEQLAVADTLLYNAANNRLSELVRCVDAEELNCFTPNILASSKVMPDRGAMASLVDAHTQSVQLAIAHCMDNKSSPFCQDLELSDIEWGVRANSALTTTSSASEEITKQLAPEAHCALFKAGRQRFHCVAGDYTAEGVPPLGSVAGRALSVGEACASLPSAPKDTVAVVRRGGCTFEAKALALQQAGYLAVIIVDHKTSDEVPITPAIGADVDITVVMVSAAVGQDLVGEAQINIDGLIQNEVTMPWVEVSFQRPSWSGI